MVWDLPAELHGAARSLRRLREWAGEVKEEGPGVASTVG